MFVLWQQTSCEGLGFAAAEALKNWTPQGNLDLSALYCPQVRVTCRTAGAGPLLAGLLSVEDVTEEFNVKLPIVVEVTGTASV
jgi:hypothetical protein